MELSKPPKVSKYHAYLPNQEQTVLPQSRSLIATDQRIAPAYDQSFQEIRTGMLPKKTMNASWKKRFFVLTPVRLLYYSDENREEFKGCFNLASLGGYKLTVNSKFPQITLSVSMKEKEGVRMKTLLVLQVEEESVFEEWSNSLRSVISDLQKHGQALSIYPCLKPTVIGLNTQTIGGSTVNFWNRLTISTSQLISYASHLDILLLRSNSSLSCVNRFFMRSYYDHVGVVLKDQSEKPFLLEVVHDKGVIISSLEKLMGSIGEQFQEVGYRKLIAKTDILQLQRLETYINNLIGKKYQLSLSKIFIDNENEGQNCDSPELQQELQKPQKTYFCSQLVADIYLKFGVLSYGISNKYWPKDFQGQLPLTDNFNLTSIMTVQLSNNDSNQSVQQQ